MSQELAPSARDVSISYHHRDGSRSLITHRVWDIDRFIARLQKTVDDSRGKDKPEGSDVVGFSHVK